MSNLTNTVSKSYDKESKTDTSIAHQSLPMSEHSPISLKSTEDLRKYLALAFPASLSQSQVSKRQKTMSETCGLPLSKLLKKYSQRFSLEKMFQVCCRLENHNWVTEQIDLFADTSELFYATFPKQGMVESGTLFSARMISTVSIDENGYGLEQKKSEWLTPTASENKQDIDKFKKRMEKYPNGTTMPSLSNQVAEFPTPNTMDGMPPKSEAALHKEMTVHRPGRSRPCNLRDVVNLYPSPRASEYKGSGKKGSKSHQHMLDRSYLCAVVQDDEEETKHLNPDWTEALMMWPVGWTSLEPMTELNWDVDCSRWEQPIPRVKPKKENHVHRLKAIGNGQVSLCAAVAWEVLKP